MTIFEPIPVKNTDLRSTMHSPSSFKSKRFTFDDDQELENYYLVITVTGFKDHAAHLRHKDRTDPAREAFVNSFLAMIKDGSVVANTNYFEAGKVEFANSYHFERE